MVDVKFTEVKVTRSNPEVPPPGAEPSGQLRRRSALLSLDRDEHVKARFLLKCWALTATLPTTRSRRPTASWP